MVGKSVWPRYQGSIYCPQSWQGEADALSRNSCGNSPVEGIGQGKVHVVAITSNLGNLLTALDLIQPHHTLLNELRVEQKKDPSIDAIMEEPTAKQSHAIAAKAHC